MPTNFDAIAQSRESALEINKVLRNTYSLLSMTLLFSAAVAYVSMSMNLPHPGLIIMLVGFYGLMFAIHKFQNSSIGLVLTFVFTGFLGYTLGPILNMYLQLNMFYATQDDDLPRIGVESVEAPNSLPRSSVALPVDSTKKFE